MSMRTRLRRLGFGLATVSGLAPRGFFIPYRYAGAITPPGRRPPHRTIEDRFAAAEPDFAEVLSRADRYRAELDAIERPAPGAPSPAPRWGQSWFPPLDAAVAYAMVRHSAPKAVIEVGSGHSTRFLMRALHDGAIAARFTAIDPAPRAAIQSLSANGRTVEWIAGTVQAVDAAVFDPLGPGDVLFIDSSHILMPGTDVDVLFNTVLPRLPSGVLVHIHDVFLPDDYPEDWAWRGYNEQLAIPSMILGGGWTPLFASRYVETRMEKARDETLVAGLPNPETAPATSLWLVRT